jgi:hypothetical protein
MKCDLGKLDNELLGPGAHSSPKQGLCLMEAVSYVMNEPHSAHPHCVADTLMAVGITLNDSHIWRSHQDRTETLVPFIPRLINTAYDGRERGRMVTAFRRLVLNIGPVMFDMSAPTVHGHSEALSKIFERRFECGQIIRRAGELVTASFDGWRYATEFLYKNVVAIPGGTVDLQFLHTLCKVPFQHTAAGQALSLFFSRYGYSEKLTIRARAEGLELFDAMCAVGEKYRVVVPVTATIVEEMPVPVVPVEAEVVEEVPELVTV